MDPAARQCLPGCSAHGSIQPGSNVCTCDPGWTGACVDDGGGGDHDDDDGGGGRDDSWCLRLDEDQFMVNEVRLTPSSTGKDCSIRLCNLNCGPHGSCQNGGCVCDHGWTGHLCQSKECDPR